MNILILAAGTRNLVVRYFKKALQGTGKVIAADASELAPALYEADQYYIVPPIFDLGYIDRILEICVKEKITGLLSLIDPELSLLAQNEAVFRAAGTTVIGSSSELCEMALNKYRMYSWLKEHGYRCADSWVDKDGFFRALESGKVSFPVFVKPVKGSASFGISKVYNRESIDLLFDGEKDLMIQEYLGGQEIGVDVYIDLLSGETVSIFTKRKIKMRAGETDKAVSFKDPKLFDLIEKFAAETGFRGPVDIDVFEVDGEYYISEVNPRFGGGYPHAYESGCDFMKLILNNLQGKANRKDIGAYKDNVYMMKYSEVKSLTAGL